MIGAYPLVRPPVEFSRHRRSSESLVFSTRSKASREIRHEKSTANDVHIAEERDLAIATID